LSLLESALLEFSYFQRVHVPVRIGVLRLEAPEVLLSQVKRLLLRQLLHQDTCVVARSSTSEEGGSGVSFHEMVRILFRRLHR